MKPSCSACNTDCVENTLFTHRLCSQIAVLLALILPVGCQSKSEPISIESGGGAEELSHFQFENVTDALGLKAIYRNGREAEMYAIPESLGGGGGVIDVDADDWPDLVLPGGGAFDVASKPVIVGLPPTCWRNLRGESMAEISSVSGVDRAEHYSHGTAVGDCNNDGFQDLLITGFGGIDLWVNAGDGTFELQTGADSIADSSWSSSAGWGDIDGDGMLDLYVAHYVDWSPDNNPQCPGPSPQHPFDVCPPRRFNGLDDSVFRNHGDGQFVDQTEAWGLKKEGKGLGVFLADADNDTDLDIYVANDTTNNFLYLNQGDGHLEESGLLSGGAVDAEGKPNGSMGVAFFDFDQDQQGDIWVTNFEQESFALYNNVGRGNFLHVSRNTGITSLSGLFVGFGTVARDFDGDGDQDIAVANGHVIYHPDRAPLAQQSIVIENQHGKNFKRALMASDSYFSEEHISRGIAAADFDRDGQMDMVITQLNGPAQILKNTTKHNSRPIRLHLQGTRSNRHATGARVVLHLSSGDRTDYVIGGGSYLSASETECEFFVPVDTESISATVYWPNGDAQTLSGLTVGGGWIIVEGRTDAIAVPR